MKNWYAIIFNLFLLIFVQFLICTAACAQELNPVYYDIGSPHLTEIWIDPINGNDNNSGNSRNDALLTLSAAWASIPGHTSSTGYKIKLITGNYTYRDLATNNIVGLYLDERDGSYDYPIIIESADGYLNAHIFSSLDFRAVSYVYLIGLDFRTDPSSDGGGNTVHFANSNHILLRDCTINGFDGIERKPQETLKVNQVQYMYVENCDISGAFWFALDFVGVQFGHIHGCKIHDASVDCLLLKGGTAQIRVEDNLVYNADRFGFSAGQGTGFDFMVVPWIHYEAYDLKFLNNIIYDTGYAGIAVLGGYNILIAYNTLYKIGIDPNGDRTLLTFNLGQRGCDGAEIDTCDYHHSIGGWGPGLWSVPPLEYGVEVDCIPNKNVFVYNNIFYNPGKDSTIGGHFEIRAPYDGLDQSSSFLQSCNILNPALSDDNLQIRGNLIWNGSALKALGIDENTGAQDTNKTCNRLQLISENFINKIEPEFLDVTNLNFHPSVASNIYTVGTYQLPDFFGLDRPQNPPVPLGNLSNSIFRDFDGNQRILNTVGAFSTSGTTSVYSNPQILEKSSFLYQNYPNPFNSSTNINYYLNFATNVKLKVYDVLGKEIILLINEYQVAGIHKLKFDAEKYLLSSGIYFYQLQSEHFIETKKFIILK